VRAALLVVHGHGEHSGRYGNVVNCLVPAGYAVYAFDLRGHGRSPGPRGHVNRFDEYGQDARAFLGRVCEQEPGRPIFMFGHSLGGLIGLHTVLHDSSGLAGIVASGPLLCGAPVSPALLLTAKVLSNIWPRFSQKTGLDVTALSRDAAVVDAYVADPLVHSQGTARLSTEVATAVEWCHAHAAELKLPVFIIHGGADRLCAPEGSRRFSEQVTAPDRRRREYEGYYHEMHNDVGKERVLADVDAWLGARC
jgi:alpha-beta hydrolase superfamily lysophospholipase